MKDIGSIFPLYDDDISACKDSPYQDAEDGVICFSLCREAMLVVAQNLNKTNKRVLIPAYTCDTVITPFKEAGWNCIFYPVSIDLRIDIQESLKLFAENEPALIVSHPYCGMDLNEEEVALLEYFHNRGCRILVDYTQCIFSQQQLDFVDYYVGSYRKWFSIPDGGYLLPKNHIKLPPMEENKDFVSMQTDAMYLRGQYFRGDNEEIKKISIRLNKMAVESIDFNLSAHKMSKISFALMLQEDKDENQQRRFNNYCYLYEALQGIDGVEILCKDLKEVTTAPLYFMIYAEDRKSLQSALALQHVYAPVIWPVYYDEVLINDTIKQIYEKTLAIPIDQRYDAGDMAKIIQIIKEVLQ